MTATWRDDPDDLVPVGSCGCGRDLADAADLGVSGSRQVIEMPLGAQVVQYDSHAVACACGRVHEAAPPADAGEAGTVTWGLNARALAVFLMVIHHVPVGRCAGILESLSGIRTSDGLSPRARPPGGPGCRPRWPSSTAG
jgi:transposase